MQHHRILITVFIATIMGSCGTQQQMTSSDTTSAGNTDKTEITLHGTTNNDPAEAGGVITPAKAEAEPAKVIQQRYDE